MMEQRVASNHYVIVVAFLKYPEFATKEKSYKKTAELLAARLWSQRWDLKLSLLQTSFRVQDSIRFAVSVHSHSQSPQTLDTTFLNRWQEGLALTLHPIRDMGCEDIWGDFPLIQEQAQVKRQSITLAAGASFTKTFVLARNAVIRSYGARKIELSPGTIYTYHLEYWHPTMPWIRMSSNGGRFKLE